MPIWTLYGLGRGKVTTPWPTRDGADSGQTGLLGMPRFAPERCAEGCRACADVCPTDAIAVEADQAGTGRLTVGRCVAFQLRVETCPEEAATASSDWAFTTD